MEFTRLVNIRERLDLSQRQMATKLNVSKSTYARWETGEKIIPLKHLVNFCNICNLSPDYVLGITNTKKELKTKLKIDKKIVGENIKEIRQNNNLSQEKLANELTTTHSTISAYEHGKTLILTSFAYQICIKYKVSFDWLIEKNNKNHTK